MTWGTPLALCDDCEALWSASEYWRLLQRKDANRTEEPDKTVEDRLLAMVALARSDRGPRRQS